MTNSLSYHASTASHKWSISLVSDSSWFPRSMTLSLLVDIASVASENPPPVTSSYGCWRGMPFVMITSDKNLARSALFPVIWNCSRPVEVGRFDRQWAYDWAFFNHALSCLRFSQCSDRIPHQPCLYALENDVRHFARNHLRSLQTSDIH